MRSGPHTESRNNFCDSKDSQNENPTYSSGQVRNEIFCHAVLLTPTDRIIRFLPVNVLICSSLTMLTENLHSNLGFVFCLKTLCL